MFFVMGTIFVISAIFFIANNSDENSIQSKLFRINAPSNSLPSSHSNSHSNSQLNFQTQTNSLTGYVTHSTYSAFSAPAVGFIYSKNTNYLTIADTVIYRQAYYSINGSAWQSLSLNGISYNNNTNWVQDLASATLPNFGEGEHYIVAYSCKYSSQNNSWDCQDGKWQLQIINNTVSTPIIPIGTKYLVKDAVPQADIVVSPSASNMVKLAGSLFQKYIKNMTGATLPISANPNAAYNFHVYIGKSSYTDALGITDAECKNGGYKIISGDNYLVMLGNDKRDPKPDSIAVNSIYNISESDERGSMNAVHAFLYEQGMRWYAPISIGTIIPQKQSISFAPQNQLVNPDFSMRGPYIYYKHFGHLSPHLYPDYDVYLQWQLAQGFNSVDESVTGDFVHGIRQVLVQNPMSAHPDFYAIWDGVRVNAPDLCSEGLFHANVEYVRNLILTENATMVSVMPTDGYIRASESSAECKSRETPQRGFEGRISDYTFEYVNNVAWEIYNEFGVDRKILCAAYGAYLLPPLNLSKPLAPNLQIVLTKWRSDNAVESTKIYYNDLTNDWLAYFATNNHLTGGVETNKFYSYDYYLINRWQSTTQALPAYFPHIIQEDLNFLYGKSQGEFMEIYSNWPDYKLTWDSFAVTALNLYVTGKLYWDVHTDVDALLNEYYNLYYGPAADEMKALVQYSEANFIYARDNPTIQKTLRTLANNALNAAGANTIEGKRVNEILKLINSNYIGPEANINSCQTLSSASTVYKLTSDVSSPSGNCMFIDADDVTLDCQGHKITFSTAGVNANDHAIYINANWHTSRGDFFKIKNCIIQDGSYLTGNTTGAAVYISDADFGIMENTRINTSGAGIESYTNLNTIYRNNIVNANTGDAFFVQYGSYQGSDWITTNLFQNNVFSSVSGQGAYLYRVNNDTIVNNTFRSVSNNGLNLFYSVNTLLKDNYIISNRTGLYLPSPTNLTQINNTIRP
jgi:hypothetical protein